MNHTMIPKRTAAEAARPRFELLIDEAFAAIANPAFAAIVSASYASDRWACERLYLVGACGWTPEELDELEDLIAARRLDPDGRLRDVGHAQETAPESG